MPARRRHVRPEWVIPAWYAVLATLGGTVLPRLEARFLPGLVAGMSPASAMAIFSAVGTGMIALTGIVFSLAFVMVQFSSTAYSPRLVLWLARDPVMWHAIGIFCATFLYSIGAIAWLDRGGNGKVPLLTTWLVIVLLLASVGMFIALIERIGLLQIHRMLGFTADHGRRVIEQTYPIIETPPSIPDSAEFEHLQVTHTLRHTGRPVAVQALDVPALLALSARSGGIVVIVAGVGDTLVEGTVMARIYRAERDVEAPELLDAFHLGDQRTFDQDPKYAIRLLVDIAIRALSPAINDPTTAVQALDHIEDLLLRLGRRRLELGALRDGAGALRIIVPHPAWDDFLILAFDEIRYYGAASVQVMRRMKALAADLILALPPERHASLQHWQRRLDATIAKSFHDLEEQQEASVEDRQGLGAPRTLNTSP